MPLDPNKQIIFDHWSYVDPDDWRDTIIDYYEDGRFEDDADDDEKWDNITDEEKWAFLAEQENIDYDDEKANLQSVIGDARLIVLGTAGLWYGNSEGGFIAQDLQDAIDQLRGRDDGDIGFYEDAEDGLHITFAHHDGTHDVTVKTITDAGERYREDNYYNYDLSQEELERTLFTAPKYSELIRPTGRW